MKPIQLTENSLLLRLAETYGGYDHRVAQYDGIADACTFTRKIIRGFLFCTFLVCLGAWAVSPLMFLGAAFAGVLTVPFEPYTWAEHLAALALGIEVGLIVIITLVVVIGGIVKGIKMILPKKENIVPSAATELLDAFSNKYCVPLVIEGRAVEMTKAQYEAHWRRVQEENPMSDEQYAQTEDTIS